LPGTSQEAAPDVGPGERQPPRASVSDVAIVIPCYRVAPHIAGVIRSIPAHYARIVCVDDASPDETVREIERLGDPRVTVLRRPSNGGVGAAVKAGYREALRLGARICVKMDGDGQMSADDLDDLVQPVLEGRVDYAKGNRFVDLRALRQMPRRRLVGNGILSFASKLASGYWNMLDVTNGFTAVTAEMVRRMDLERVSDRYFFETSMLIELNILRATIADVEMPARYGAERSSIGFARVLATFPGLLVRGLARRFYWRYLIDEFSVVSVCVLLGLPLALVGALYGAWHWFDSLFTGTPATAGTVFVAALPIILGFQLLLAALLLDVLSSPTRKVQRVNRG
jgi:glycosyltransferase involved in cell wall biosynthesis